MSSEDLFEEIVHHLVGTCQSLSQALADFEAEDLENDLEFLEALDNEIFLCDQCGWWCPINEMGEEGYCLDCEEENEL